jgi:hypothetical protein
MDTFKTLTGKAAKENAVPLAALSITHRDAHTPTGICIT